MKTKVYVAGPYTHGDKLVNALKNIHYGHELLKLGYQPFVPLLSHWWHIYLAEEYETWMEYDREWLLDCDVVLRTPGHSEGADREVAWAKEAGIPVVYGVQDLRAQYPPVKLVVIKDKRGKKMYRPKKTAPARMDMTPDTITTKQDRTE